MKGVQLTKLVQELGLHNLTPEIDLAEIWIKLLRSTDRHFSLQGIWSTLQMNVCRLSDMWSILI